MKAAHLIRNSLLAGVFIGLLTGCSWLEDWPPAGSNTAAKTAPKPPQSKIQQTADAGWPGADRQAAQQAGRSAPMGLAIDDAAAARIAQLEQDIASIRNQLDLMMPALTKLAEAQGDIQKVLAHVEPAAGGAMAPMPRASAAADNHMPTAVVPQQNSGPQPGSVAWYEQQEQQKRQQQQPAYQQANYQQAQPQARMPQQQVNSPVQAQPQQNQPPSQPNAALQQASYGGSSAAVTNVRFGEHTDKTRLVLDTSEQVSFSYDVDNRDMLLTISLPNAAWRGATQMTVDTSPIVASYNAVSDGAGGQKVIMQLRQPVRVLWAQALQPGGPQGNRVVFDIAPL